MTIRIDDENLVRRLSELAQAHQQTIEVEVMEILASAVRQAPNEIDRLSIANEISAMTPKDRLQADSTHLVREDRDHGH